MDNQLWFNRFNQLIWKQKRIYNFQVLCYNIFPNSEIGIKVSVVVFKD